jgi:hypothetical protein
VTIVSDDRGRHRDRGREQGTGRSSQQGHPDPVATLPRGASSLWWWVPR